MFSKEKLEAEFGSETALGIQYVDSQNRVWSPKELDTYFDEHGQVPPWSMESEFPDGSDAVRCTHYAIQVMRKYPDQTLILGFKNEDNPNCEFAQKQLHPGGHDFAVIEDRWLVDPWVKLVRAAYQQVVYDLLDPVDFTLVRERYGRRDDWKLMQYSAEDFKTKPRKPRC
jgi:hypothetical protein